MKRQTLIIAVVLLSLAITGCKTQNKSTTVIPDQPDKIAIGDNSANSLDWPGVYNGTLPCADCEGLITSVTLNKDLTYKRITVYKGKDGKRFEENGNFSWIKSGSTIMLERNTNLPGYYLVGENQLIQLDMEGNRITGDLAENYMLTKNAQQERDVSIFDTKWKLVELNGKPVENNPDKDKVCFIRIQQKDNRISGFAGCNSFFGTYELNQGNRIIFSKLGSTMMACPNMAAETELLKVLETVNNYTISGNSLYLNRALLAPLVKFEMMID